MIFTHNERKEGVRNSPSFLSTYTTYWGVPVWPKPFDFCYISIIFIPWKKLLYDIHIFCLSGFKGTGYQGSSLYPVDGLAKFGFFEPL